MTGKMRLMILIALGVVSFGAALVISTMTGAQSGTNVSPGGQEATGKTAQEAPVIDMSIGTPEDSARREELTVLIREVRARLAECRDKQAELDGREKRLAIARETLDEQAKGLEQLRVEIVAPLARLKEVQEQLRASRITIAKEELENLRKIALIYQSKDSTAAAETIIAMCKNNQEDDAVKILFFMSERSAGKVLSEIQDRALVANIYEHMKRIRNEG
jgi:flagellar motility protein MotE (MotC chaperone)